MNRRGFLGVLAGAAAAAVLPTVAVAAAHSRSAFAASRQCGKSLYTQQVLMAYNDALARDFVIPYRVVKLPPGASDAFVADMRRLLNERRDVQQVCE